MNRALATPIISAWFRDFDRRRRARIIEIPEVSGVWPEVGSRAMQGMVLGDDYSPTGWIVVQKGRYRYNASLGEGMAVSFLPLFGAIG